ncbi:hypothetical protein BST61_g6733 [Cercospora zeina]
MPSTYNSSPFLSLRPDAECGRSKAQASRSFASLSGHATPNGHGNGVNGHSNANGTRSPAVAQDEFLRLDAPQQDLLLLHGPRQKYKLEKSSSIPELQGDREILIQVLAIGLNPVDWKGADFGFSQPSYPWVNGRDFAGIVVRAPRTNSRVQQGDIVFGPSTDYRDVRKAAYQEYVVTTDYNVTRIPQGVSVKQGAALGVAYVAAITALGVSFGLDLSNLRNAPRGPDLLQLTRQLDPRLVPDDIRDEIFSGIPIHERPQPGEWLAIWGANSMTGQLALQVAKHAGLKVACIADLAHGGQRLSTLGADFMVDKYDDKRAIDILKAVSSGKLRFGLDCNGKESATSLQDALAQSDTGLRSHLLGLNGLPKSVGRGVVHHKLPIKIFHEAPIVGEAISVWLEDLLVHKSLQLPEVEIAQGGLAGINDALDRMRTGTIGGKRVVVPVGEEGKPGPDTPISNGVVPNGIAATATEHQSLEYADSLNSDPDRVRFAYWVPNVSGGLVISKIKQNTQWGLKPNIKYAKTAERVGFEYALSQIRFMAGYGAEYQHEPVSMSQALLHETQRLKLIIALLPGPWNPAVASKIVASIDQFSEGRACVNIVSGWFKAEFTAIGQWWLDHAERYRRSNEFIRCLKGIWTEDKFTFKGDFYQFHDFPLKPKPLNLAGRPHPEIFQGGNSDDAKENAGSVSDYYFMNGNTLEGFQAQIGDVKERAKKHNREGQVGFALNAFVICRETEEEAIRVLQEIQGKADPEAVEGFRQQVQNAGASTGNKSGMWANSKFEDLVQYNDGFKTKLIGTKEQIADRIVLLKSLGVNIILTAFLHYDEEIEQFGREVLPLVRELERQGRGKDTADEIRRTGDVYKAKEKNSSNVEYVSNPPLQPLSTKASNTGHELLHQSEPEHQSNTSSNEEPTKAPGSEAVAQSVEQPLAPSIPGQVSQEEAEEHEAEEHEAEEHEAEIRTHDEEPWFVPEAREPEHFYGPAHDQGTTDELELGFQISEATEAPEDFVRESSAKPQRPPPEVFTAETIVDEHNYGQALPDIPSNSSAGVFRILDGNIDSRVNSPVGSLQGDDDDDEEEGVEGRFNVARVIDHVSAYATPNPRLDASVDTLGIDHDEDTYHAVRQDDTGREPGLPVPSKASVEDSKGTADVAEVVEIRRDVVERPASPSERRKSLTVRSLQSPSERPTSPRSKAERSNDRHGLLRRMTNSLRRSSREA